MPSSAPDLAAATPELAAATADIIRAGQRMDARGWVPATAGNISRRLGPGRIAITASGFHKGFLHPGAVMQVDEAGTPLSAGRPSAETLLHCQIYQHFPEAGAVLHGHSVAGTLLSMASAAPSLHFSGYEMLKAFAGQTTHATTLHLPLVDNDQDMPRLAAALAPLLPGCTMGYLIRGHGAYVWAPDMDGALARLEALEFLLACMLEQRRITP